MVKILITNYNLNKFLTTSLMFSMQVQILTFLDFTKTSTNFGVIRNFKCLEQRQLKIIGFEKLRVSQKMDHFLIYDNRVDGNTENKF
jgi:hypothetical protein